MSIVAGILVVLFGKVFRKFEQQEFDLIFWIVLFVILVATVTELVIIYKISKKTHEIKEL